LQDGGESELEQVEHELAGGGSKRNLTDSDDGGKKQQGGVSGLSRVLGLLFSQVFLKSFTLTFLAEWGDRSQIATIGCVARRAAAAAATAAVTTPFHDLAQSTCI
jgi:putative Ca2+/H+ antiporter (TMEM165/GDT1 family)